MRPDRQRLAELLEKHEAMPFVKEMAARFGNNGKLQNIAIFTDSKEGVFVGDRPVKARKCPIVVTKATEIHQKRKF